MKTFEIDCPVFKTGITYIIDCDYQNLRRYVNKKYDCSDEFTWLKDADGTAFIVDTEEGGVERIVWLESFKMNHSNIGVLVHETTHAVVRILDWKGIPYSSTDNQDETFAYLMDYFISNFIYQFKKK